MAAIGCEGRAGRVGAVDICSINFVSCRFMGRRGPSRRVTVCRRVMDYRSKVMTWTAAKADTCVRAGVCVRDGGSFSFGLLPLP